MIQCKSAARQHETRVSKWNCQCEPGWNEESPSIWRQNTINCCIEVKSSVANMRLLRQWQVFVKTHDLNIGHAHTLGRLPTACRIMRAE